MILVAVFLYRSDKEFLMDAESIKKYGSLYSNLRVNSKSPYEVLWQPFAFLFQRFMLAFFFVLIPFLVSRNLNFTQFIVLIILELIYLIFLAAYKPYWQRMLLFLEFANHFCMIMLVYMLFASVTDLIPDVELSYEIGGMCANIVYFLGGINILSCLLYIANDSVQVCWRKR